MFTLIYGNDPAQDAANVLIFMNDFAEGAGVRDELDVDLSRLTSVTRTLQQRETFPHKDGFDKASVFKKAAYFVTTFISESPVISRFPNGTMMPQLLDLPNHQNVVLAFEIAIEALHGAMVNKSDGQCRLENRIAVSDHSYVDIIDALSEVRKTSTENFKLVCVLLEQLAYRMNNGASYPPLLRL